MKKILMGLLFVFLSNPAEALIEIYWAVPGGFTTMDEFKPGYRYDHQSIFDVGLAAGLRLRPQFFFIKLGGVIEGAWVGRNIDRTQTGQTKTVNYRHEEQRSLAGPSLAIMLGDIFSIEGEFYSHYAARVSYSDEKSENPWKKGDSRSGNGWGAGFGFHFWYMSITMLYRELTIKNSDYGNVSSDPKPEFGHLTSKEGLTAVGFEF